MIKTIEDIQEYSDTIEIQIIPKLKEFNELSLSPGDTLVAFVDHKKWTLDNVQEFYNLLQKIFPNNNICILFDGIELGVIHED